MFDLINPLRPCQVEEKQRGPLGVSAFPPLHVVQHEGSLIAICGNCQLYLHRVLVNLRVVVWPLGLAGPPGPVRRFVNSSKKCPSGARSIVKSACAEARAGNITALRTFLAESPTQVDIATRVPHVAGFGHDEYIKLLLEHGASAIAPQARSDEECDIPVLPGALTTQLSAGRFHNSMLGPHAYEVFEKLLPELLGDLGEARRIA